MPKKYVALKGFSYPTSLAVRNRIRKEGPAAVYKDGEVELHEVPVRAIVDPPLDLLESWLRRGLIKEVVDDAQK